MVIGVIDSGMTSAHPLAEDAIKGAFGAPATLGDNDECGHGTPVTGIAIYGDIRQRVEQNNFEARFFVACAKVVNHAGKFPDETLVPQEMERAIRRLHDEFHCQVINISLGDRKRMAATKPTPWAAMLDSLARELDLIIVVSAGNRTDLMHTYGDEIVDAYPACLTDAAARILEPATAVNVLTVGSLAHSNGLQDADEEQAGVVPLTSGGYPSPFTRTGPGVGEIIKPDFVDFGGTVVFDGPTQTLADGRTRAAAGVISLNRGYVQRMLTAVSGTSFCKPTRRLQSCDGARSVSGCLRKSYARLIGYCRGLARRARLDCLADLSEDEISSKSSAMASSTSKRPLIPTIIASFSIARTRCGWIASLSMKFRCRSSFGWQR